MGKHIGDLGLVAGKVNVHVNRVVIARGTTVQGQGVAGDRGQFKWGQFVAHLHLRCC